MTWTGVSLMRSRSGLAAFSCCRPRSSLLHSARIVRLAARARLPTVYEHEEFAEPGGLLSYGPSHRHMFRRLAAYVDKGAKPAELPIEQPTKFELAINLKTAKPSASRSRRHSCNG